VGTGTDVAGEEGVGAPHEPAPPLGEPAGTDELTASVSDAGYPDGVGEPAGQSVTVAAQLVTVTSWVTSTVEVYQPPVEVAMVVASVVAAEVASALVPQLSSPYAPGGANAGDAKTEVARAAATMAYFIFAVVVWKRVGFEKLRGRKRGKVKDSFVRLFLKRGRPESNY